MQLERIRIQNYKCLQDVNVEFRSPAQGEDTFFTHLLVGVNGSGKSCFLEALGLIFTRIMQGEVPGFPFVLEYRVRRGRVKVCPAGKKAPPGRKLEVTITAGGLLGVSAPEDRRLQFRGEPPDGVGAVVLPLGLAGQRPL